MNRDVVSAVSLISAIGLFQVGIVHVVDVVASGDPGQGTRLLWAMGALLASPVVGAIPSRDPRPNGVSQDPKDST